MLLLVTDTIRRLSLAISIETPSDYKISQTIRTDNGDDSECVREA